MSELKRPDGGPRIREEDGAVWVEGLGFVDVLPTYGGREKARKLAQEALEKAKKAQQLVKADQSKTNMGFG